jgi:hypothetical protein
MNKRPFSRIFRHRTADLLRTIFVFAAYLGESRHLFRLRRSYLRHASAQGPLTGDNKCRYAQEAPQDHFQLCPYLKHPISSRNLYVNSTASEASSPLTSLATTKPSSVG